MKKCVIHERRHKRSRYTAGKFTGSHSCPHSARKSSCRVYEIPKDTCCYLHLRICRMLLTTYDAFEIHVYQYARDSGIKPTSHALPVELHLSFGDRGLILALTKFHLDVVHSSSLEMSILHGLEKFRRLAQFIKNIAFKYERN